MNMWDIALNALQVASILAAAGFAAFGLFTKYRDDEGKITRAGQFAVGGIVLSAILSLSTQVVKAETDRRKGKATTDQRNSELAGEIQRYGQQSRRLEQMERLQKSTLDQASALQVQAQNTLHGLRVLQGQAAVSLLTTRQVGEQERRNTASVLRTMWYDENRVAASGLSLTVTYDCGPIGFDREFPRILENGSASVMVARRGAQFSGPANLFSTGLVLDQGGTDAASFRSRDQYIRVYREDKLDGDRVTQVSRFTNFEASELNGLQNPDAWAGALIEVIVTSYDGGLFTDATAAMSDGETDTGPTLSEIYSMPQDTNPDFATWVVPGCTAAMQLTVNGRIVASTDYEAARIVTVRRYDEDVSGLTVVKFPVMPAWQGAFPSFSMRR